jgi:hypothetical protein
VFGGTENLTVCYWDLDSDNPEHFVLVPRDRVGDIPGRHYSVVTMDFAVEHCDPLSGFTIAFVGCNRKSLIDLYSRRTVLQKNS